MTQPFGSYNYRLRKPHLVSCRDSTLMHISGDKCWRPRTDLRAKTLHSKLSIVNLIATAELDQFVNLKRLVYVRGFLYDTAIYRCAYLKDDKTKAKVSIFSSGKMISIGTKNYEDAKHDLDYAAKRLAELGLISKTRVKAKLQNIVATGDIGHTIDIERLSVKLANLIYEPEQFPGAIYYAKELEGASILIFASGKVVIAGLKREELLEVGRQVLIKLAEMVHYS
jgi:transcription initiation factor TFIID TATA-box-binding protein